MRILLKHIHKTVTKLFWYIMAFCNSHSAEPLAPCARRAFGNKLSDSLTTSIPMAIGCLTSKGGFGWRPIFITCCRSHDTTSDKSVSNECPKLVCIHVGSNCSASVVQNICVASHCRSCQDVGQAGDSGSQCNINMHMSFCIIGEMFFGAGIVNILTREGYERTAERTAEHTAGTLALLMISRCCRGD